MAQPQLNFNISSLDQLNTIMSDSERMIRRARLNIIHKYRYFASVAMMRIVRADDLVPKMGTDGRYLYYNDPGISDWTYEEVYSVTLHEILHCVFMHMFRCKDRKRLPFQYAADYAINYFIKNYLNLPLPEPNLYDIKYKDMSTEEIYEDLIKEMPVNQYSKSLSGHGGIGTNFNLDDLQQSYLNDLNKDIDINSELKDKSVSVGVKTSYNDDYDNDDDLSDDNFDNDDLGDENDNEHQSSYEQRTTTKADELSKTIILRGQIIYSDDMSLSQEALYRKNLSSELSKSNSNQTDFLKSIIDTHKSVDRLPWYHMLQNHVRELVFGDYGFHIPNGRYVYSGFYLPAFRTKKINKLSIVIDVSGSIVQRVDMLSDFFEHIRNIAEDCIIDNIEVLTCNTEIVTSFEISSSELMFHNFEIEGGGGTNLYPPLDYYDNLDYYRNIYKNKRYYKSEFLHYQDKENDHQSPDLMIYFTDLDGEFRTEPPDFPIIWVVIEHPDQPGKFLSAPYGTEIRYIP